MRVLVACEYSGTVRDAFIRAGHYAASCDLLPGESPLGDHYQCSVLDILDHGWDLMIAHPPCTHLAVSGAAHFAAKQASGVQQEALDFVSALLNAPIPRIALENPVSIISSRIRKPDQIVQPYQFGHDASKKLACGLKDCRYLSQHKWSSLAWLTGSHDGKIKPTQDKTALALVLTAGRNAARHSKA